MRYRSSQELSSIIFKAFLLKSYHFNKCDLFYTIKGFESPALGVFLFDIIYLNILVNSLFEHIYALASLFTKFPLRYFKRRPAKKDRGRIVATGIRVVKHYLKNP